MPLRVPAASLAVARDTEVRSPCGALLGVVACCCCGGVVVVSTCFLGILDSSETVMEQQLVGNDDSISYFESGETEKFW